ncbi:MAG: hypothetical protein IJ421_10365 [Prevotella sp.]|nr:hypothetical protein [Prevotella sp.]
MDISFRIWRFDLKLMPAFHYNITNNYRYHIEMVAKGSDEVLGTTIKPTKRFFAFNGGLTFLINQTGGKGSPHLFTSVRTTTKYPI